MDATPNENAVIGFPLFIRRDADAGYDLWFYNPANGTRVRADGTTVADMIMDVADTPTGEASAEVLDALSQAQKVEEHAGTIHAERWDDRFLGEGVSQTDAEDVGRGGLDPASESDAQTTSGGATPADNLPRADAASVRDAVAGSD